MQPSFAAETISGAPLRNKNKMRLRRSSVTAKVMKCPLLLLLLLLLQATATATTTTATTTPATTPATTTDTAFATG